VAELFKNGGQSLLEALHKIIVSIWEKEVVPKEWNTDLISPIFEKEITWRERITEALHYSKK
jgi:hypothetical protein